MYICTYVTTCHIFLDLVHLCSSSYAFSSFFVLIVWLNRDCVAFIWVINRFQHCHLFIDCNECCDGSATATVPTMYEQQLQPNNIQECPFLHTMSAHKWRRRQRRQRRQQRRWPQQWRSIQRATDRQKTSSNGPFDIWNTLWLCRWSQRLCLRMKIRASTLNKSISMQSIELSDNQAFSHDFN